MKEKKLWNRNFSLMVIGQLISLFGNAVLRYALPLYLLNQTKSAALLGVVSACSFIPMIILSPIGGMIADRVNKRNIMVVLDFLTAFLVLGFSILSGKVDLIPLMIVTLMLLYGIQGCYQPAVQASLPILVEEKDLLGGNAVINQVSSFSSLIGPAAGGALYGIWGIKPILFVSCICFLLSAVMEIFIQIPFEKKRKESGIWQIVKQDMKESIHYMHKENPIILFIMVLVCLFNLFLTSLLIIGMPVLITQHLGFSEKLANQLYGYSQAFMAAGGLGGGIIAGIAGRKLNIKQIYILLLGISIMLFPIGALFLLRVSGIVSYIAITICCFIIMAFATIFTIQVMAYIQMTTPDYMVGKVISCVMAISICAQPLGQTLYGFLFEKMQEQVFIILFSAAGISCVIAVMSRKLLHKIPDISKLKSKIEVQKESSI